MFSYKNIDTHGGLDKISPCLKIDNMAITKNNAQRDLSHKEPSYQNHTSHVQNGGSRRQASKPEVKRLPIPRPEHEKTNETIDTIIKTLK